MRGHVAYYAVPGNTEAIEAFREQVTGTGSRRSGVGASATRSTGSGCVDSSTWLPPARFMHPFPDARFNARTLGRSPVR